MRRHLQVISLALLILTLRLSCSQDSHTEHCFESSIFSQASDCTWSIIFIEHFFVNNKYTIYKFKRDVVVKADKISVVYGFENLDSAGRTSPTHSLVADLQFAIIVGQTCSLMRIPACAKTSLKSGPDRTDGPELSKILTSLGCVIQHT